VNYYSLNIASDLGYVKRITTVSVSADTRGIIALNEENTPQGVVLFDQFTETACTAHIAITNPMALRGLHIEAFTYAFKQVGKRMILGPVESNNEKALKLNKHLGFTEIARIKDAYAEGVDMIVLQLLREDCKYITELKEVA